MLCGRFSSAETGTLDRDKGMMNRAKCSTILKEKMSQFSKHLTLAQRFSFQDNPAKATLDLFKTRYLNMLEWPRWTSILWPKKPLLFTSDPHSTWQQSHSGVHQNLQSERVWLRWTWAWCSCVGKNKIDSETAVYAMSHGRWIQPSKFLSITRLSFPSNNSSGLPFN